MAKETPKPILVTVGVEALEGELFQLVIAKLQGNTVLSVERPHPPHVWGHVRFEFEQACLEKAFPEGKE